MADVFVSYSRSDKARVAPLVAAIQAQGWSVWWDPAIDAGQQFDDQIDAELQAASAVLVVWTPTSVASRWVRGEARDAASAASWSRCDSKTLACRSMCGRYKRPTSTSGARIPPVHRSRISFVRSVPSSSVNARAISEVGEQLGASCGRRQRSSRRYLRPALRQHEW